MSIVVRTLSDQIFTVVRDRIASGSVPADTPIRQDTLANELGVSKIPLREALIRLEQDGLIDSQANRGFFVRPLTADEAEEVFALRLKLEPEAVAMAAREADEAERLTARAALEALEQSLDHDLEDVGRLNREFHLSMVRRREKQVTARFVERLNVIAERYVRKHLEPAGRHHRATQEHRDILAAWSAGQADRAAELTHMHIAQTLADLRRQFMADTGEDATRPDADATVLSVVDNEVAPIGSSAGVRRNATARG